MLSWESYLIHAILVVCYHKANSLAHDYVMRCLERTLSVFTGIKVRNNNFYRIGLLNVKRSYCVTPSLKEMDGLDITDMRVEPCVESQFIKTARVVFKQVSSKSSCESRIRIECQFRFSLFYLWSPACNYT